MTNKTVSFLLLFMTFLGTTYASDALWALNLDKEVAWTKHTECGILLVATNDYVLKGIDANTGELLWESDLLKGSKSVKGPDGKKMDFNDQHVFVLEDEEVKEIANFAMIKFNDNMGSKNFGLINMKTGELIVSPEKAGMPIQKVLGKMMATFNYNGSGYVPEIRAAILSAEWVDYQEKGNPEYTVTKVLDLPSGNVRWESQEIASDVLPVVTSDGNLLFAGKRRIAKLNANDGSVIWSFDITEKKQTFENFDTDIAMKNGYFFEKVRNSGQVTALDLSTGKRLWTKELKLKEVPTLKAIKAGVMVIDSKSFEMYDIATGDIRWTVKKVTGDVVDLGSRGIAIIQKEKFLKLIDEETGADIWEQKIKGIRIDQVVGAGLMYVDDKNRLGVIDYQGQLKWAKKGMLPAPELRIRPEFNTEIIYADGKIYTVDLQNADWDVLIGKVGFEGKETPERLELLGQGLLLSSSQNLFLFTTSGDVVYHKYWEAPGLSLAAKIALRTLQAASYAVAAGSAAQAGYLKGQNMGFSTWETDRLEMQAESWGGVGDAAAQEVRKKFTASKSKGNYNLILTIVGDGGQNKGSGIVKVDVHTGDELNSIQLGDKKPVYDYDPVTGQLFFKADKKQIESYQL
ncbi:PQQ-binding-like beta-propeller repeat protein [Mangrovibacterium marinum]|uniref:Putative pyrroloquinoline-quinone binding quinoprotein n=1 Tax=Mangrovibacterium marinum TaxID=1639118 RepID=A0A2T5BX37_9BACT|nr:PQQ-binding-like beta-propeller repeat protein [Mangrovibacterium marinum]PTN04255.1 putative pyrroloquinoline-quinone binding quinoprotein [Mangrovibacterium marinum]